MTTEELTAASRHTRRALELAAAVPLPTVVAGLIQAQALRFPAEPLPVGEGLNDLFLEDLFLEHGRSYSTAMQA